jgi:hypothetical protein
LISRSFVLAWRNCSIDSKVKEGERKMQKGEDHGIKNKLFYKISIQIILVESEFQLRIANFELY